MAGKKKDSVVQRSYLYPGVKNGSAGADGRRRRHDLPAAGGRDLVALTALNFKLSASFLFFSATQRRLAGTYPFSNITSQADVLAQERTNLRLNLRRYLGPSPAAHYAKRTVVERLGEVYYWSPAPRARPKVNHGTAPFLVPSLLYQLSTPPVLAMGDQTA